MKKVAVFVSGGGSNLQSLIDAVKSGSLKANIQLVVADRTNIQAIDRANTAGIEVVVFEKSHYENISLMYEAIIRVLKKKRIDFIVLAGYLNILSKNIVKEYHNRIINIHLSLIPKYSGMGYYGLNIHKAVIENKESVTGVTVHYVDEGTDTGKIIEQVEVAVFEEDTPETLQRRVLQVEHQLLPWVLDKILRRKE